MDKIEKIRQEIERRMKYYDEKEMKAWDDSEQGDEDALWYQGHRKMCAELLTFLNTLTEEPDKNLGEEIQRYLCEECSGDDDPTVSEIARHFAKWQYQKDREEFAKIKAKTWCEGFDAHKEQMLKNAVEGYVNYYEDSGGILIAEAQVGCPYHTGDKVRIIVLKEGEE